MTMHPMTIQVDTDGKSLWFSIGVDLLDMRTPFVDFFPGMLGGVNKMHAAIKPKMLGILREVVPHIPHDEQVTIEKRRFRVTPKNKSDWKKLLPIVIHTIQVQVGDQVGVKIPIGSDWPLVMLGKPKLHYKPRPKK